MRFLLCFFSPLLFSLLPFSFLSFSAHGELFHGPLSSGLAGTGRAGMDGAEAGFLNPGLVPLLKNYEMDAYFRDGSVADGQRRQAYGVGAGDNGPDVLFPGTLHYIRTHESGRTPTLADGELIHAAIGRLILPQLAVGISGYRLSYKVQDDKEYVQYNYSLGAIWMITHEIGVGYVLDNLAKPSSEVPLGLREDMKQGIGFFSSLGDVARARLDLTRNETNNPDHKLAYMASLESQNGKWGVIRLGYRRDDLLVHNYVTAGFGFNGPRLKLDYSFEKQVEGASGALHSVDLRLPF